MDMLRILPSCCCCTTPESNSLAKLLTFLCSTTNLRREERKKERTKERRTPAHELQQTAGLRRSSMLVSQNTALRILDQSKLAAAIDRAAAQGAAIRLKQSLV
jgi:hypothetical protein